MQHYKEIKVGNEVLYMDKPVVMTILNVTPDSFWEQSRYTSDDAIARAVDTAAEQGAKIIDIGGYSSRPGAHDVSAEEELRRVLNGLRVVRSRQPSMIVSLDSFRSSVVRRSIEEYGPCIINDISGGDLDPRMIETAAALKVPFIATHMRGRPITMQQYTDYEDVTDAVKAFFAAKIKDLKNNNIEDIILDPGFGFAKTTEQNYQMMYRMHEFLEFGYPVLSGISRKSMIYKVLDVAPKDTLAGTTALNWESLRQGASILRVHDTREAADTIKLHEYYKKAYES